MSKSFSSATSASGPNSWFYCSLLRQCDCFLPVSVLQLSWQSNLPYQAKRTHSFPSFSSWVFWGGSKSIPLQILFCYALACPTDCLWLLEPSALTKQMPSSGFLPFLLLPSLVLKLPDSLLFQLAQFSLKLLILCCLFYQFCSMLLQFFFQVCFIIL